MAGRVSRSASSAQRGSRSRRSRELVRRPSGVGLAASRPAPNPKRELASMHRSSSERQRSVSGETRHDGSGSGATPPRSRRDAGRGDRACRLSSGLRCTTLKYELPQVRLRSHRPPHPARLLPRCSRGARRGGGRCGRQRRDRRELRPRCREPPHSTSRRNGREGRDGERGAGRPYRQRTTWAPPAGQPLRIDGRCRSRRRGGRRPRGDRPRVDGRRPVTTHAAAAAPARRPRCGMGG